MKTLLINLLFTFYGQALAKIDSINVNYENGNKCFSWSCSSCSNTINFYIFVNEGVFHTFPTNKIDVISKDASKWCFNKRIGFEFLGMDLKSYTQWGKNNVLTEGESYTIGIKRVFLDKTTQKEKSDSTYFILHPFELLDTANVKNLDEVSLKSNYLASSYSSFIKEDGKVLLFANQSKSIEINSIFENKTHYLLTDVTSTFRL